MKECISKLQEVQISLIKDKRGFENQFHQNLYKIEEIEKYIQSILDREDPDFKMFSPRNVESKFKDVLQNNREEVEELRKQNAVLQDKLDLIDYQESRIKEVIEKLSESISSSL